MDFILLTNSKTYDVLNHRVIVGGVQTYVRDLCILALNKGYHAVLFQIDSNQPDCSANFDGIEFHIVHKKNNNQSIFNRIYKEYNSATTLFVVASDQMDIKTKAANVIVIQHGIAFDNPIVAGFWSKAHILLHINKMLRCVKNVRRFYRSRNTVCVDYNYLNWFRTLGMVFPDKKVVVIPNYSRDHISTAELEDKIAGLVTDRKIKVVFSRRFCSYRGTKLFMNCIDRLLPLYPNVEFTFAGEGELRDEIEHHFKGNARVHITKFTATESIAFHKQFDIAVVPTIYSEGTSLSLLEAMSAGCFPIATYVGGLTNIIIDHFNGLLCYPDEDGVFKAFVEAFSMDAKVFKMVVKNAYESAVNAFSYELWQARWSQFMDDVMKAYVAEE